MRVMKKTKTRYDRDFKLKAIQLSYENGSVLNTAKDLQISKRSLSLWRNILKKNGDASFPGNGNLTLSPREKKIYILEKKINDTNVKFEILKNAKELIYLEKSFILNFMIENEKNYSIRLMCEALAIHTITYYKWRNGFITEKQKYKIRLKEEISSIFVASRETYGSWRIAIELEKRGYFVSPFTVLRHMRELGLFVSVKKNGQAVKKQKNTTNL